MGGKDGKRKERVLLHNLSREPRVPTVTPLPATGHVGSVHVMRVRAENQI